MKIVQHFPSWLLLLLLAGKAIASSSTEHNHVPVTDIEYFLENGKPPEDARMDFPTFLTSTIVVSVDPMEKIFDSAEATVFGDAMKYFYEQIFDSQAEYDLTVRAVDIVDQKRYEKDATLELETIVDVNFRPDPKDQILTDEQFQNIVVNLVNKFESQLVGYVKNHHATFRAVESVRASSLESANAGSNDYTWVYILSGVAAVLILGSLTASYLIYKRRWNGIPFYSKGSTRNLSPFQEEEAVEFPEKETLVLDDEDDLGFVGVGLSSRFSFRPQRSPDSPDSSYSSPSRNNMFSSKPSRLAAATASLTLDAEDEEPAEAIPGNRAELWAPAGKLGVAIDVVDGQPVVWRIKDGSPVDGFLQKGDVIIAIDEIDTSHMSAADVTSVMVRRMRQRRKITYVRPTEKRGFD